MQIEDKYSREQVLSVRHWSEHLFSFEMTRPAHFKFTAGQFARIGVVVNDELVVRAYSVVSSPYSDRLEFFSIYVPDGKFTSQLKHLQVDDSIYLEQVPYGFLTLARYQQPVANDLWLIATGTGLAPFLSVLQDFTTWQNYQHIRLVYSVRFLAELAYAEEINQIEQQFNEHGVDFKFIPIVTREAIYPLQKRLPELINNGDLETEANLQFAPDHSHIMLCGNPQMVDDTRNALKERGLTMNRRGVGNIAVENYW